VAIELKCSTKTPLQRPIRATVGRLLTDRDEGLGIEIEDYIAYWVQITVDDGRRNNSFG
jgi:hypothetical protein